MTPATTGYRRRSIVRRKLLNRRGPSFALPWIAASAICLLGLIGCRTPSKPATPPRPMLLLDGVEIMAFAGGEKLPDRTPTNQPAWWLVSDRVLLEWADRLGAQLPR